MEEIIGFFEQFFKKVNKKKLITAAVALFVVIAVAIGLSIYLNSPSVLAIRTTAKFAKDLSNRDEFATVAKTLTKGSVEASMSSLKVDDEEYFEDMSISGKAYFSSDAIMLENLKFKYEDFKLSGSIYASPDLIYVNENEVLKGAYGIDVDNFAADFRGSIFAYGSGSKYQMFYDEDMFNALMDSCDTTQDEKMMKDAEKIITNYTKQLYKSVCEHGEIKVEKDKVRIDGKKQSVRIITISLDEKAASAIAEDMLTYIVEDDSVIEFLEKYESKMSMANFMIKKEYDEESSVITLYQELIEELESEIDDICEDIAEYDFDVEVEMVTPRGSAKLLQLSMSADGEKLFTLDVGKKGIKDSEKITLSADGTKAVYEIKEKGKNIYKSTFKVDDTEYLSINIDYSKGKYEIKIGDKDSNYSEFITIKGKIEKDGKAFNMTLDKIERQYNSPYYSNTTTIETNLKLTVKTKDKMPKAPTEYELIDDITEEDIEKWGERINDMVYGSR